MDNSRLTVLTEDLTLTPTAPQGLDDSLVLLVLRGNMGINHRDYLPLYPTTKQKVILTL